MCCDCDYVASCLLGSWVTTNTEAEALGGLVLVVWHISFLFLVIVKGLFLNMTNSMRHVTVVQNKIDFFNRVFPSS